MKLDPRIKLLSDIITCFDEDTPRAKNYVGQIGYFSDDLMEFDDLESCTYGKLENYSIGAHYPFSCSTDGIDHAFFIPELALNPKEKQYRPYTIDEFFDRFHMGEVIVFRSKVTPNIVCHVLFVGYTETGKENDTFITLGQHRYSLKELFTGYERFYVGRWYPFGVEE